MLPPRCEATARNGGPCKGQRLRGTTFCRHHLKGPERAAYDALREPILRKRIQTTINKRRLKNAEQSLRSIGRKALQRAWLIDPRLPGSTLMLSDHDEARAHKWLLQTHNVDLEALSPANEPWTPRAIDRLRWCAHLALSGVLTPIKTKHRVILAGRDDVKFFEKLRLIEVGQWPPPKKRGGNRKKLQRKQSQHRQIE